MICKIGNKRIILLLSIGFLLIATLLWHKQENTNKTIPKRAQYVLNINEWRIKNV